MFYNISKKLNITNVKKMTFKEICILKLDLLYVIIWSILVLYLVISPL